MSSNFNQAAVVALHQSLRTQAAATGLFRAGVIGHEPKSPPGHGVTCAIWLGPIEPVPRLSSLIATAGRVQFTCRVHIPFAAKPEDGVETDLQHAVFELLAAYTGKFTLGGTIMQFDLLGAYGPSLEAANVGYTEIGGSHFRVAEITIPVIITDLWTQAD